MRPVATALRVLAIAIVVSLRAAGAYAAALPDDAVVTVGPGVDAERFAQQVADLYDVRFVRVVTADIDHDGDVDVLTAAELDVLVWLNDGAGRLTRHTAKRHASIAISQPADTWNDGEPREAQSVRNELPSPRLPEPAAHGPPGSERQRAVALDDPPHFDFAGFSRTPRAPPDQPVACGAAL